MLLPQSAASSAGTAQYWAPFGDPAALLPGVRIQTTYSASELLGQNVNQRIIIRSLRWRPDENEFAANGGQFTDVKIQLSTSSLGWNSVSGNFATNHGPDRTLVYDAQIHGPIVYQPTPGPLGWTQSARCVDIQLATPFLYNPAQGDLVVDIDYPAGSFTGVHAGAIDASAGSAASVVAFNNYPHANLILYINPPVIEIEFGPAIGLFSSFGQDIRGGPSPLTIQFSDKSFSSTSGGVSSWAWDFDNDGTIDSTVQNPTHTYTVCGTYDVALTVGDGTHPPAAHIEHSAVITDRVVAAFEPTVIAPRVVQYTDQTSPAATAWAWDLDGDQVVDSTLRNPTYAYATTDPVTVTLTASRLCGTTDTVSQVVTPLEQLVTPIGPSAFAFPGWTPMFDLEVKAREGIDLQKLDFFLGGGSWQPFTADIWLTGNSYQGKQTAAGSWQLVGQAIGSTPQSGTTVTATLASPIHLPRGHYGMALHVSAIAIRTVGVGPAGTRIENSDVALDYGVFRMTSPTYPFGPATELPNRIWSGILSYEKCRVGGRANHGFLGEGCPGTNGRPTLTAIALPQLGSTAVVDITGLPTNAAVMAIGFDNRTSALGPLPAPLHSFGMPGCMLRVRPDATLALVGSGGSATWQLPIPNDPALACVTMFQQAAVFDPGTNPAGLVVSDAAGLVIGN